eukprot:jgi/Chlat1/8316/Chrsp78S07725
MRRLIVAKFVSRQQLLHLLYKLSLGLPASSGASVWSAATFGEACCWLRSAPLSSMASAADRQLPAASSTPNSTQQQPPPGFSVLKEGQASILQKGNDVFYNKAQVVNRDLSIVILRLFIDKKREEEATGKGPKKRRGSASAANPAVSNPPAVSSAVVTRDAPVSTQLAAGITVLEALAASGLRSIRYAKEVAGIRSIVANDSDASATAACTRNIEYNGVQGTVSAHQEDARLYMLRHEHAFDVVDIDPYGSPSIFLDSAVQSVADGGMLMCTATDMAVLCGNNGEVCHSKYGAYPLRGKYCHEMALRILLACIESHANRYKRYIEPVLALSVDFYVRVFVRIYTSAATVKETPSKLMYVYQCSGCDSFHLQPLGRTITKGGSTRYSPATGPTVPQQCEQCGKSFHMGGAMWAAPIHNSEWVRGALHNAEKMKKTYPAYDKVHSILTAVSEEIVDCPLYVSLHSMSGTLKCTPPSASVFRSAVVNAGYKVSSSHANPLGLKTDAPMSVLWDIMRSWVKQHPVKPHPAESPGSVILSKEPALQANFSRVVQAMSRAQASGVARFLPNPETHWGPKPRAGRNVGKQLRNGELEDGAAAAPSTFAAAPEVATANGNGVHTNGEVKVEEPAIDVAAGGTEPPSKRAKLEQGAPG